MSPKLLTLLAGTPLVGRSGMTMVTEACPVPRGFTAEAWLIERAGASPGSPVRATLQGCWDPTAWHDAGDVDLRQINRALMPVALRNRRFVRVRIESLGDTPNGRGGTSASEGLRLTVQLRGSTP